MHRRAVILVNLHSANCSSQECESVGEGAVFQWQDLAGDGLDDGNGAQCHTDENAAADQHGHGGRFGRDDGAHKGDQRRNGGEPFAIQDVAEAAHDW